MQSILRGVVPVALVASSLLMAGCLAFDGKAERTFSAKEAKPARLVVENRFLDVSLTVATGEEVAVDAKVILQTNGGNETAEREIEKCTVSVVREGNDLIVRQGKKGENVSVMSWSGSGTLAIALPAGVPFVISSASGDVRVNGDFGDVAGSLSVASGDIGGSFGVTSLSTKAASGDTSLVLLRPLTRLSSDAASGDISITGPSIGEASVDAASGDVNVQGLAAATTASAASGDVRLLFVEFPASAMCEISTASGDILIELPQGAQPSGSVSTASGDVTLGVPGTKVRRGATLSGTGASIKASAASGDVTIRTSEAPKKAS